MEYKIGDTIILQDGMLERPAVVLQNGVDSRNRVRVRPSGIPIDMSVPLDTSQPLHVKTQ